MERPLYLDGENLLRVLVEDAVLVGLRIVERFDEFSHEAHLHRPLKRRVGAEHDMIRAREVNHLLEDRRIAVEEVVSRIDPEVLGESLRRLALKRVEVRKNG